MEKVPITSCWQSRLETPDQLAQRLRTLLRLLRPIAPEFVQWLQVIDDETFRLVDEDAPWLAAQVAADIHKDELGLPSPYFGYYCRTMNTLPQNIRPGSFMIHLQAGGRAINSVALRSLSRAEPGPDLLTYPIFKQAVLAITQAFEPDWCEAGPYSLWQNMDRSVFKTGPIMTPAWMINLSPPLAKLVTPPSGVISEPGADGSLFMAATDQPFSSDNPIHVAAAQRIHAVIDPLHDTVPFNGRMRR